MPARVSRAIATLLLVTPIVPAAAGVISVRQDGGGDAETIAAGLALATPGDTVSVACGTYLEHDLEMKSGVTLRSVDGEPDCVTIDAELAGRGIACEYVEDAVIEGLRITRGRPFGSGGGIYCYQSSPVIRRCHLVDNATQGEYAKGGGLRSDVSSPVIVDCVFEDNRSTFGGAVYAAYIEPELRGCRFERNAADSSGGALFLYRMSPEVRDCEFVENTAITGAAVSAWWLALPTISHCSFVGNVASTGAGVRLARLSHARIESCTFHRNEAADGSAFEFERSDPVVVSTLVTDGLGGPAVALTESAPAFACTDIHGNAGGDWVGPIAAQLGVDGNFSTDPRYCDPDAGLGLRVDSPCLPGFHPDGAYCGIVGGVGYGGCDAVGVPPVADSPRVIRVSPNPSTTSIRVTLPDAGAVDRAEVVDAAGRHVRWLQVSDDRRARWDGMLAAGRPAPAGLYWIRAGDASARVLWLGGRGVR